MVKVAMEVAPFVQGHILIMANPTLALSTSSVIDNATRMVILFSATTSNHFIGIEALCRKLAPEFDISRLCIKVPATWEGLQACKKLKQVGIKTLATTLFTMEQAILAAEAGAINISPFGHELQSILDET
jgi:transaldolase